LQNLSKNELEAQGDSDFAYLYSAMEKFGLLKIFDAPINYFMFRATSLCLPFTFPSA